MLTSRRYLGTHVDGRARMGEARVFLTDRGFADDGRPYLFRKKSNRIWMGGGPGGEAILRGMHLLFVYTVQTQVRVTPIVDGVAVQDAVSIVTLTPDAALELSASTVWVSISEALSASRSTRRGLRGASAQVMVEFFGVVASGASEYILAVDSCHLEVEVVREAVPEGTAVAR